MNARVHTQGAALLPLLGARDLDAPLAWRGGQAISGRQYLADVAQFAAQLPERGPVVNLCVDRYAFAIGLGAAMLRGLPSLLPPDARQDTLDRHVEAWTRTRDAYQLMELLQTHAIPAGVCQTAADRCDRDPQLAHLKWLTELDGTKIGRWPVAEFPVKLAATPAYAGGFINRGAPCYGEDNDWVLGELLGMSKTEITALADEGVI